MKTLSTCEVEAEGSQFEFSLGCAQRSRPTWAAGEDSIKEGGTRKRYSNIYRKHIKYLITWCQEEEF